MKIPNLTDTVNLVLSDVLEHAAFVFPESADISRIIDPGSHEMLAASLTFSGDSRGTMTLILTVPFCREMAGNILGEDIDVAGGEADYKDAAKEIANIAMGQLLPRLFGDKALFTLSPPETRAVGKEELSRLLKENDFACSMVDEYPIIAIFTVDETQHEHQSTRS